MRENVRAESISRSMPSTDMKTKENAKASSRGAPYRSQIDRRLSPRSCASDMPLPWCQQSITHSHAGGRFLRSAEKSHRRFDMMNDQAKFIKVLFGGQHSAMPYRSAIDDAHGRAACRELSLTNQHLLPSIEA